jgi:hypothetical protein
LWFVFALTGGPPFILQVIFQLFLPAIAYIAVTIRCTQFDYWDICRRFVLRKFRVRSLVGF